MIPISERIEQYLAQRAVFGTGLSASAAQILRKFAAFTVDQEAEHMTTDLFLRWKEQPGSVSQQSWSGRLSHVRIFACWLQALEPATVVPPKDLIPAARRRPKPYIYTDKEVVAIITEASRLPSHGLRGITYATLFGLLAVTGLRISEAVGLDDDDVDTNEAALHIRHAKNGHSRVVPITPCTAERLLAYRPVRDRICGRVDSPAFFLGESGRRIRVGTAEYNFFQVSQKVGLRQKTPTGQRVKGPRLHDLRHTMAVRTLIDWFWSGVDPDHEMYKLSTWLGHSRPNETYWYLEAVPELLELARERAERAHAQRGQS